MQQQLHSSLVSWYSCCRFCRCYSCSGSVYDFNYAVVVVVFVVSYAQETELKYARLGLTSVTNYRTRFHKIWVIGSSSGSRDTRTQRGNFTCQTI